MLSICQNKESIEKTKDAYLDDDDKLAPPRPLTNLKALTTDQNRCLSSDRINSLTDYFGSIVPRGTRGSGQKEGAGGFTG